MPAEEYRRAVLRIQDEIRAGHVYQVNLTYRCDAPYRGDPVEVMERLIARDDPPYAAYVDGGDFQVISASPELFLKRHGTRVETAPMKGTRPRGGTPEEDQRLAMALRESVKDRAEHVMIVDLERHDLGRIAAPGTVRTEGLFEVEGFPTVWQMVSRVIAEVPATFTPTETLQAVFPGGSVTGAPKSRVLHLIHELESLPRRVYTGALGWIGWDRSMTLNMPIRTMTFKDGWVHFHVGGGITIDSDPEDEFQETVVKSRAMLNALVSP